MKPCAKAVGKNITSKHLSPHIKVTCKLMSQKQMFGILLLESAAP